MFRSITKKTTELTVAIFALVTGMVGCADFVTDGSLTANRLYLSATVADLKASCTDVKEDIEPTPVKRLTTQEYSATIRTIFQCQFNCYYTAYDIFEPILKSLPADLKRDSISTFIRYTNLDQQMSEERVTGYHTLALAASEYTENQPAGNDWFRMIFDGCYTTTPEPDLACQTKMVKGFGLKAFRRPVSDSQLTQILAAMAPGTTAKQKLGFAVYYILMSPDFLFHMESDGSQAGSILTLDSYAVASKLSYLIMGRNPDAELLNRASEGKLQTKTEIDSALEYMKATYPLLVKERFWKFTSEWLDVSTTAFTNNAKSNAQSAPDFNVNSQGAAVREEMNLELRNMFEYYLFDQPSTYLTLLTNEKSFAKGSVLSSIYGVPAWNGTGVPPNHVPGQRKGFLTTAALLTPGSTITHPFTTGGLVHKHILCREFGDNPEPKNFPGLDQVQEGMLTSTRTKYENLVPRSASCMGCHASIESLGMPFQTYDTFGRFRAGTEKIHASDGSYVGSTPINSRTTPTIGSSMTDVADAVDMITRISKTSEPQACLAKQFLRFAYARKDGPRDSCALYRLASNLETMNTWDAFKSFIVDDWFTKRRLE